MLSRAEYQAGLPRKSVAAGALIRDVAGRVCLVEPTYKKLWHLPGGTIERDESPAQGCRRELREELGLDLPVGPLLGLDWVPPEGEIDPHGALQLVFDGGVVEQEVIDRFVLPAEELRSFRFVTLPEVPAYASARNQRRIEAALAVIAGAPALGLAERDDWVGRGERIGLR